MVVKSLFDGLDANIEIRFFHLFYFLSCAYTWCVRLILFISIWPNKEAFDSQGWMMALGRGPNPVDDR